MLPLSVVIPTRNESRRLPETLAALHTFCLRRGHACEVIIADDGSTDGTPEVARQAAASLQLRVLTLGRGAGVGVAVKHGMLAARGARVLLCDADGPVPFADLLPLWHALDQGYEIAAGSRGHLAGLGPTSVQVPQPRHRIVMGRVWSALVQRSGATRVRDTQCGFKLFTHAAAQSIFALTRLRSFAFHVEALALAERLGLKVCEVGVRWRDVPGSKVHLVSDPAVMLLDLVRLALANVPGGHRSARRAEEAS